MYAKIPISSYWRKARTLSKELIELVQRKPVKQNDYLIRFICLDVLELLYYQGVVHWNALDEYYHDNSYFDAIIMKYIDTFKLQSRRDVAMQSVNNLRHSHLTFSSPSVASNFIHLLRDDILYTTDKGRTCKWTEYDGTLSLRLASACPIQVWLSNTKSDVFETIACDWLNAFGINRVINTQSKIQYMRRILNHADTLQNKTFQLAYMLYLLTLRTELYRLSPEDQALSTLDYLIVNVQYA